MLDMGFIPDIEHICKLCPFTRQTLFFSATMPPEITRLTEQFLHNPVRVEVSRAATTAENIMQNLVPSGRIAGDKRETLRGSSATRTNFKNAIIFCNRKRDVHVVCEARCRSMASTPRALHGDLDQRMRTAALDAFRAGEVQLLVAPTSPRAASTFPMSATCSTTTLPLHADDYVHRIGRTGRAGKSGEALTIVSRIDQKAVAEIEKLIARKIDWQEGAQLPGRGRWGRGASTRPKVEGAWRRADTIPAPVNSRGGCASRSASETRADSRRHHAERPARDASRPRRRIRRASALRRRRSAALARAIRVPEIARNAGGDPPRDDDAPVIGLGDHVPDFLLRPVKARAKAAPEPIEAEE